MRNFLFDCSGVKSLRDIHMLCKRYIHILYVSIMQICVTLGMSCKPSTSSAFGKPSKLSDLNDDCLMEIFKDFSLTDLVNVVEFDEGVANAARILFNNKFRDQEISVSNTYERETEEWSHKLLKHFGSVILKLCMEYKDEYRRVDHIFDNLIVSECSKSLEEITFVNADFYTMNGINEPFEMVHKVTFVSSKFCDLIPNFEKWFPKADTLLLVKQPRMSFKKRLMLEHYIPELKRFSIENTDNEKSSSQECEEKVNNYNIATFIKLNPQLEHVSIFCDQHGDVATLESQHELLYHFDGIKMDQDLLGIINSKLRNLKDLEIVFKQRALKIKLPKFHFDELSILKIRFHSSTILDSFPISTGKVKQLILTGYKLRPNILKFIKNQKNVQVLKLQGKWNPNPTKAASFSAYDSDDEYVHSRSAQLHFVPGIIRLAPKLPLLNQLYISYQTPLFQANQMVTFLESCNLLQKLVIQADDVWPESKQEVLSGLQGLTTVPNGWKTQFYDDWDDFGRYRLVFTK